MKDKEEVLNISMKTITMYREIMKALERDLLNTNDELVQQQAIVALKTFHCFFTHSEGYNTWYEAIVDYINHTASKLMCPTTENWSSEVH